MPGPSLSSRRKNAPPGERIVAPHERTLFDQMPDCVSCYDLEGRILYVNPALARLIGRAPTEIEGGTVWQAFPNLSRGRFRRAFQRAALTGLPAQFDLHYLPWSRWFAIRVYQADRRVWVIGADVTDARAAQARLRILAEASRAFAATGLGVQAVFDTVARKLTELVGDSCVIRLVAEDGVSFAPTIGLADVDPATEEMLRATPAHPWSEGLAAKMLRTGEPVLVARVEPERLLPSRLDPEGRMAGRRVTPHSIIMVPVRVGGRVVAALAVARRRNPTPFNEADLALMGELAVQAGQAIRNAQLYEQSLDAYAAAERERQRMMILFMQAPVPISITMGPEHRYVLINEVFKEMLGGADHVGRTVANAHPEAVGHPVAGIRDRVYRTGERCVRHAEPLRVTLPAGTASQQRYFTFIYEPLRDIAGRVEGVMALGTEVTDQVLARQRSEAEHAQMAVLEERLRLALESAAIGTWDLRTASGELTWDPRCRELFGLRDGAVSYADFLARLHPEDRARVDEQVRAVLKDEGGGDFDVEYRVIDPDNAAERWVAAHGRVLRDASGRAVRFIGTAVDISARKRVEAAREAEVAKLARTVRFSEIFVGMLGHDLRNPLSAIGTNAGLIARRAESARSQEAAQRILVSTRRMARMIDQLLDFTRIRVGEGIPIQCEQIDLGEVVRAAVEELRAAFPQAKLITDTIGDGQGYWDRDRLGQLLSNLGGNAVRHGEPGGAVSIRVDGRQAECVRLEVANRGAIDPEQLPTLFEPMRGQTHRRAGACGLGLGLYITRQIALAHGGEIQVESRPEIGTRFVCTLPRRIA